MGLGLENPLHIAIILVVILLIFGAKRLPEMGRGLGQGMREFKDGITSRGVEPTDGSVPDQLDQSSRVAEPTERSPV